MFDFNFNFVVFYVRREKDWNVGLEFSLLMEKILQSTTSTDGWITLVSENFGQCAYSLLVYDFTNFTDPLINSTLSMGAEVQE